MKNLFSAAILGLSSFCAFTAVAQTLPSGYYRVQNHKTSRYTYVLDNTGSIDMMNVSIDGGAIELWKNREFISDPATVLYANHINQDIYNLESQGTGVYQIIGYNVHVNPKEGSYEVSAQAMGVSRYLADDVGNPKKDQGAIGLQNTGEYRKWDCLPIDAATDSYFGIQPELEANGKYYQPFYASFPFNCASSGMKVYVVRKIDSELGVVVLSEIEGNVPAATPVIIETSSANPSDNRLNLLATGPSPITDNALGGVYFNNETRQNRKAYDANTMRMLSVTSDGKLTFEKASISYLPANKSYLNVSGLPAASLNRDLVLMTEQEYQNASNTPVSAITLNATTTTLTVGETFQLTATVAPADASDPSLTWTSSNVAVATVSATGLVTAVSAGSATITAKANDGSGVSASCTITVQEPVVLVTSVTLSETSATLIVGDTFQLEATVSPEDATDTSLTWTSSKPSVATVDANGLVTAVAEGKVTITAKANDGSGKKATCTITVEKAVVLVGEIVLDQTVAELEVGKTLQLTASVLPADADDATVTWRSSDETLATVSASGLVEALAVGEVVITATANDESGVSASCTITIKPDSGIEGVRVDSMGAADIYNLSGMKVRLAGESLEGLTPGLYIVGGNKVIIY